MLRPTDTILYPSRATAAQAIAGLERVLGAANVSDDDRQFARDLEEACNQGGVDFAFAWAHACNEADYLRDSDYVDGNNAFGIGHDDNAASGTDFPSKRACARFYVIELLLKLRKVIPPALFDARDFAPNRYEQIIDVVLGSLGPFPTIERIADLNKRFGPNNREAAWMTDPTGPESICAKGNTLFPSLPDQTTTIPTPGGTMTFSTNVPGVPGGPLVTDYPIRQNLTAVDGYQRNGIDANKPRRSIQHGTDNASNQSAWNEAQYFVNGAEDRRASVHSFADDHEVVIGVPLDEVAWQAADDDGPGNMNGFANEMMEATAIWVDTARRNRLIYIAADFMGRCSARFGVTKPERHWDFNAGSADRHHCPNKLMSITENGKTLWDGRYVPQWEKSRQDELKRMAGTVPPKPTTPPNVKRTPLPKDGTDFWKNGYQYTLNAKQRRVLIEDAAQYAGPELVNTNRASRTDLPKGKTLTLRYVVSGKDENGAPVLVFASTSGTHIRGSKVVKK